MKPPGFTAAATTGFAGEEAKKFLFYFIGSLDRQISAHICLLPGVSPMPPCPPLTAPANDPLMTGRSQCETLSEYVSGPGGVCAGRGAPDALCLSAAGMWIGDNQAGPGMWSRGCWAQEGRDGDGPRPAQPPGHPQPAPTLVVPLVPSAVLAVAGGQQWVPTRVPCPHPQPGLQRGEFGQTWGLTLAAPGGASPPGLAGEHGHPWGHSRPRGISWGWSSPAPSPSPITPSGG